MILTAAQKSIELPHDCAMPGIECAAPPAQMLEICRERLVGVPQMERDRWTRCIVKDAIYQPGRSCRIAYALEHGDEERSDLVYARWPAEPRTHASAQRIECREGTFDLYRYPRDRRLRQIRAMRRDDWLRDASSEWFARLYGDGRFSPETWRCSPIKYVPESRLVCRLKGHWQSGGRDHWCRAYVRFSRRNNAIDQVELLTRLDRAFRATCTSLSIAQPLGALNDHHLLATEFVRGPTLRDSLIEGDHVSLITASGKLATVSRIPPGSLAKAALGDPVIAPRSMLDELASGLPELAARVRPMIAWADTVPRRPERLAAVHGDLHCGQVIQKKDRWALVDWDLFHIGDPTQDITNLAGEIETMGLVAGTLRESTGLAGMCVEAWLRAGGDFNRAAARWWAARGLVLRAWGLQRHLRPGWPVAVRQLLERAVEVFQDGCEWTC